MIDYSEDWLIFTVLQREGSVFPRSLLFALPAAALAALLVQVRAQAPELAEELDRLLSIGAAQQSQLWTAAVGVLSALITFRVNLAMARFWEGTSLLHQMRGEWFDSVSCCVTFSSASLSKRREETLNFRHTIVRLMSLCHGSALADIGGTIPDECLTIDSKGLNEETRSHLKDCMEEDFKQVEAILHMIQSLVTANLQTGVLKIPPPILSRVYQTLSRGFVNLLNAKKIADTRFPFPLVQVISFLLLLNLVLTPVMTSALFTKAWMAAFFAFLPIFGLCCMNLICAELENPFGSDPNDLPLDYFQAEMNNCLILLLHDSADLVPSVDMKRCLLDVNAIREGMMPSAPSDLRKSMGRRSGHLSQWSTARISNFKEVLAEEDDVMEQKSEESKDADRPPHLFREESPNSEVAEETRPDGKALADHGEKHPQLGPEQIGQGIQHIADILCEIKEAVAAQAEQVGHSVDAFKSLAENIDLLERKSSI